MNGEMHLVGLLLVAVIMLVYRLWSLSSRRNIVDVESTKEDMDALPRAALPASRTGSATKDVRDVKESSKDDCADLLRYKTLYHKLQNLEDFPDTLSAAHEELISLLAETLHSAQLSPSNGILRVNAYSRAALETFLKTDHHNSTEAWQQYLERRRAGGPREMFSSAHEAKWWLKNSAPVKYVDGAWLGHIAKVTTPFNLRRITKNAWQVMSEELGDGDLKKNHVFVYEALMRDIGANLPPSWTKDFIHPRHDLNELRCWKAAVAQLLISLFPHEFLPEALGFNMAYEGLPLHLMKTTKELRELKLNDYYFVLHISIDNADSGHAAMAMEAAIDYIEHELFKGGDKAAEIAWRRVQAGFIMAEGLPTTPESPSLKTPQTSFSNELESKVARIFASKAAVAHKIHCSSRVKIGSRTLVDWLEPNAFKSQARQRDFLLALSNSAPWVIKGQSGRSKLALELGWEGRMYGAFTEQEVTCLRQWIDALGKPPPSVYYDFTLQTPRKYEPAGDIFSSYPCITTGPARLPPSTSNSKDIDSTHAALAFDNSTTDWDHLAPLWLASTALLENFVNVPAKVANEFGSAIVRVLRAQMGFGLEQEGVAGMDEVRETRPGLVEIGLQLTNGPCDTIAQVMQGRDFPAAHTLMELSTQPFQLRGSIIGASYAFARLHEALARDTSTTRLTLENRSRLAGIAQRELAGLEVCLEHCRKDPEEWRQLSIAHDWANRQINKCLVGESLSSE